MARALAPSSAHSHVQNEQLLPTPGSPAHLLRGALSPTISTFELVRYLGIAEIEKVYTFMHTQNKLQNTGSKTEGEEYDTYRPKMSGGLGIGCPTPSWDAGTPRHPRTSCERRPGFWDACCAKRCGLVYWRDVCAPRWRVGVRWQQLVRVRSAPEHVQLPARMSMVTTCST